MPLARHFIGEIILALEYLRSKEIVHRDLKPGNVVLDNNMHIKLIDFATCKLFNKSMASKAEKLTKMMKINPDKLPMHEQDERLFSLVGTEEYIAPETIVGSSTCYATDLWSLGVMFY